MTSEMEDKKMPKFIGGTKYNHNVQSNMIIGTQYGSQKINSYYDQFQQFNEITGADQVNQQFNIPLESEGIIPVQNMIPLKISGETIMKNHESILPNIGSYEQVVPQ